MSERRSHFCRPARESTGRPAREGTGRRAREGTRRRPRGRTGCRRTGAHALIASGVAGLLFAPGPIAAAGLVIDPSEVSTDGTFQLSWDDEGVVVIEEARDPSFDELRIVYRGADQATTLTGRSDGVYYYRTRPLVPETGSDAPGPVTGEVVTVTVKHHPLGRALGYFAVGLLVFASTVALVLRGPEGGDGAGGAVGG